MLWRSILFASRQSRLKSHRKVTLETRGAFFCPRTPTTGEEEEPTHRTSTPSPGETSPPRRSGSDVLRSNSRRPRGSAQPLQISVGLVPPMPMPPPRASRSPPRGARRQYIIRRGRKPGDRCIWRIVRVAKRQPSDHANRSIPRVPALASIPRAMCPFSLCCTG